MIGAFQWTAPRRPNMKHLITVLLALSCALLAACGKKPAQPESQAAPPPTAAPAPAAPPAAASAAQAAPAAEPSDEDRERAKKQALLDYATMEDQYINDPRGQWAASAKASSTFGEGPGKTPAASRMPANAAGAVDGKTWTNNQQDIGFDWLEVGFDKPVSATEIRFVFPDGEGVEAVSKVELQDTDGKWTTIWSGLSDVKKDRRGNRTWFVRTFDKTAYKVKAAKLTLANNVERGYKEVDAVQLVGE